jgi:hypothetical protein
MIQADPGTDPGKFGGFLRLIQVIQANYESCPREENYGWEVDRDKMIMLEPRSIFAWITWITWITWIRPHQEP